MPLNFTLIGATTENPSFELNSALLSRLSVYVLESLKADIPALIKNTDFFLQQLPH
jgi:putative ATPase